MPSFTTIKNPFSISIGEDCWHSVGRLTTPEYPSINFEQGELTEKEAKQMKVMCWLDFHGLTLVCERMNSENESFTDAYFTVKKQGNLRTFN